jgi:hypothetical protein
MHLAYLDKVLRDIPQERERALSAFREGYASKDELRAQLTVIEQKRTALSDERNRLLARLGIETVDEVQAERIERVVARVRDRLDRLTPQEQFDAVHAVVSRIVVHRDSRIEIDACIPLGGGEAERATLVIASMPS